MRVAAVTGATGFTGPFVVQALRQRFPDLLIRCVVRPTSDTTRVARSGVSFATADLRDSAALSAAFDGADTLVNVASLGFDWTQNVVSSARAAGVRRAIFISTTAILTRLSVGSRPVREKGEALVRTSGLDWTILRPTMIYGTPDDRNVVRLIRFVNQWPIVPVLARHAIQQPIHVEDLAGAVAGALAESATIGRDYNLSGAEPLTMETLVREVADALGKRRLMIPVPLAPIRGALAVWSLVRRPPVSVEQVRRIAEDKNFDHSAATADFGFAPRSFASGVATEIALMKVRQG